MRDFCKKKPERSVWKAICFPTFLFIVYVLPLNTYSKNQNPVNNSFKIKTSTQEHTETQDTPSLTETIDKQTANPNIIEVFDSTLFDETTEVLDQPFPIWLHNPEIQEKRSKIVGTQSSSFESWWKMELDGFLQEDRIDYRALMRTRINAKVLTQLNSFLFAQAEFELLTGVGSIQTIDQRPGDTSGISQRELLLLLKTTNWLTVQFGTINQRFLQAPLLLAKIPFPSIVENIELFTGKQHTLFLSFQQAVPTTFSDDHSIYIQSLAKVPFLMTKSFFWNYDSKSFYKVKFNSTFFHYSVLPSDIAQNSWANGNSIVENPASFKYNYTGFYFGLEPSFQLFSNLGLRLKAHYINNLRDMDEEDLNQGILYSLEVPFDITENIRLTPVIEYFVTQPDASVAAYNSERYGHSNRTGFVGELILSFYNRNMEVGIRHLNSRAVRTGGSKENQSYYLLFLRTGYAKI